MATAFTEPDLLSNFGVYFNMPGGVTPTVPPDPNWSRFEDIKAKPEFSLQLDFAEFPPDALKFTFRLYDSRGIIEGGREFTHIIYLGEE